MRNLQQREGNLPVLSRWTASFTRHLLSSSIGGCSACDENGDGAFILLDKLMEHEVTERRHHSIDSDCNYIAATKENENLGFCDHLMRELDCFLEKLTPARTQGDRRADDILNLLQSMGADYLDSQHQPQREQQHDLEPPSDSARDKIRGDRSIFVSREYRQQKSFAQRHPYLHQLISTISNTFDREFGIGNNNDDDIAHTRNDDHDANDLLKLDFSMTSVQVAMYPGDSKSGYRRHCDRQFSCKEEGTVVSTESLDTTRKSSTSHNKTKPERLITAIYYLTDSDWDATLDGGALRLYSPDSGDDTYDDPSVYTDVFPFRDRMIVFRSDRIQHQVMPSHRRSRLAVTIWFYGVIQNRNAPKGTDVHVTTTAENKTINKTIKSVRPVTTTTTSFHRILPLPTNRDLSQLPYAAVPGIESMNILENTNESSPSIFVSIASYRDSETRPTIDALYSMALKPERIFTGIVAQLLDGEKDDEDIWTSITGNSKARSISKSWKPEPHQLRSIRIHARDATGPCYARGLCQSLYRGEDYVLQIDSHMRFRPYWDEYLIQSVSFLQDQRRRNASGDEMSHWDKIMLTTYPVGYTLPNKIPAETRGTYLVPWKFDAQGMLRQRGRLVQRRSPGSTSSAIHIHRQFLYAGGFNFAPSRIIRDVPYDTMGLHHLFFGEELSMAVRLFTHGYDLYAPEEAVCYHLWSRAHRPTNISTVNGGREKKLRELSQAKVKKHLLGDKSAVGAHYGLGTSRTALDFAQRLGVDFKTQSFIREGWGCGQLKKEDFVGNLDGNDSLFPTDSVEAKVASLDSKAQDLIGMFLQGLQK